MPMGKSGNKVFLEFSLDTKAPNNYVVAHALANGITGNQLGGIKSIERTLTADYTSKDLAMKYPSQKNIIVKLHADGIPLSGPNATGNFIRQEGPSDIINIVIREPAKMQGTFIHEFIHFLNRDLIDGASSIMLSETLTLLFENACFNNGNYRSCASTNLYNSITSSGVINLKKLTTIVSEALLANDNYKGHEYEIAELLGQVLKEKLTKEMPRASENQKLIEITKRITAVQRDFSSILPTNIDGDIIFSEETKSLDTIAKKLGFSDGFSDMVGSLGNYYEKNIYADAKQIAGFKLLMEEFRLATAMEEETQLEIPLPKKTIVTTPSSHNPLAITQSPLNKRIGNLMDNSNAIETASKAVPVTRTNYQQQLNNWVEQTNKAKTTLSTNTTSRIPKMTTLAKIGKGANMVGRAPTVSTLWDLWDDIVGNTPDVYIKADQASIANKKSQIMSIDKQITSLQNRIEVWFESPEPLQKQITVLSEKRSQLEKDIQWREQRIRDKSLERDVDLLHNNTTNNRLNPTTY